MDYKYPLNTLLYTKDGRKIGNAILTAHMGNINVVTTDYGHEVRLTDGEIEELFYHNLTDEEEDLGVDWQMYYQEMVQNHKHYVKPPQGGHFFVKCNVCGQVLEDWAGSTPCCGSIAYGCDAQGNQLGEAVYMHGLFKQPDGTEEIKVAKLDLSNKQNDTKDGND